jgi:4-hydroxy-tetrahydrodipicolinate reductase
MLAASLGFTIARVEETIGPVLAESGLVRGVHQEAHAFDVDDRERITLIFRAAIGEPDPRDAILVDGDPPVDLVIRNGLHGDVATSAVVLNSIRSLLAARPGLHTMITLPLAGCAR